MKQQQIPWDRVVEVGTGFFGWPDIPGLIVIAADARQGTLNRLNQPKSTTGQTVIEEVEALGADGDFLRACCLFLAEIAVEHDHSQDTILLGNKRIFLGGLRETMKHHTDKLSRELKQWQSHWAEAKEALLCHAPKLVGADKVDNAVESAVTAIDRALTDFFNLSFPLKKRDSKPGRQPEYYVLLTLSGMAKHLSERVLTPRYLGGKPVRERRKREPPRHRFLSEIAGCVLPSLPVVIVEQSLRKQISRHRKKRRGGGELDYKPLMAEFEKMHQRFFPAKRGRKS